MDLLEQLKSSLESRYSIERELGRGGMAIVYLARDTKHNRKVAIKVLRPELSASIGAERFLREIEIAAGLQHPHILPLYDSGEANDLLYYVMPYEEGETLRERLDRDKQLAFDEAISICRDVAKALSHAHSMGVVHRDIKPENVWLTGGQALVMDFGIARALTAAGGETLTESGVAIGTPAYMSPEQAAGSTDLDARSDIYTLGCVLYEMLAGETPFTGPTAQAIIARHINERPPSLSVVRPTTPPAIEGALDIALAKVPADRFSTAAEFVESLARRSVPQVVISALRKRRRIELFIAAVATAFVAAGAVAFWPRATASLADFSRIAVLYFDDRSDDQSLGWLADGITEDLIDRLGTVQGLDVISQSGVRQYSGSSATTDSIGRALDVGLLVSGAVEPIGDTVRVAVRLIDAASAVLIDRFAVGRQRSEVLELREDVTLEVEQLLRASIGQHVRLEQQRREADNDEAWELTQRSRELRGDALTLVVAGDFDAASDRIDQADSLLVLAEARSPDWPVPIYERGRLQWERVRLAMGADPAAGVTRRDELSDWLYLGLAEAERALGRDPESIRALALRGELLLRLSYFADLAAADTLLDGAHRDLMTATGRDPSYAHAWYVLSQVHELRGSAAEAELAARKALDTDVYAREAPGAFTLLYFGALYREGFAEAREHCRQGRRRFPSDPNLLECELTLLAWSGEGRADVRRAWALQVELDTVIAISHGRLHRRLYVAAVLARSGMADSARSVMSRTDDLAATGPAIGLQPVEAYIWTLLGEEDRAISLLSDWFEQDPEGRDYWGSHPWFRALRDLPEFSSLVSP